METRAIVVKDIEVIDRGPHLGGGPPRRPGSGPARMVVRALAALAALAILVPAVVLGGACAVALVLVALAGWAVRRIFR